MGMVFATFYCCCIQRVSLTKGGEEESGEQNYKEEKEEDEKESWE